MNHRLKTLGHLLVALMIAGSVLASGAAAGEFHSESGTDTVLKGSEVGTDVLTVNAGTVKCNEISYSGRVTGATTTTINLNPVYSECTAFGFINSTSHYEGECHTQFSGDNNTHSIIATPTCRQTITAFNCWITIGTQTISGVTYANTGSGASRDIDVTLNMTGITYTQDSKSFPGCSSGTRSDGKYTGAFTLQGFSTGGGQVGIWRE